MDGGRGRRYTPTDVDQMDMEIDTIVALRILVRTALSKLFFLRIK